MLAVGGAYMPPSWLDPHALRPHYPGDAFVVDEVPPSPEFLRHPAVAVSGQLILDGADEFLQFGICQRDSALTSLVIVSAAREGDHLAPPSDGAGLGPVMIDEISLSLTRRRRGTFFLGGPTPS